MKVQYGSNWPNYQSFWHKRPGLAKQEGVWWPEGRVTNHHVTLGLNMKSFKTPAYQNNNRVKNAPRQPAVRHFLYNPPNIIQLLPNKFYNLTMVFYQDLLNGQFHSDFASQQPGHWGGSLSRSDLVVDLAELLLILWIVLVDIEESPLYSSSPPIASEMTHFQRVKRFLCVKTLKAFLLSDTTHSELEIQFE